MLQQQTSSHDEHDHHHSHGDENEKKLTHGFEIHSDHSHALKFMGTHMNKEQVEDMVRRAKSGHGADFLYAHDGQHANFQLVHHDGKLKIIPATSHH